VCCLFMNRPVRTRMPGGVGRVGSTPTLTRFGTLLVTRGYEHVLAPQSRVGSLLARRGPKPKRLQRRKRVLDALCLRPENPDPTVTRGGYCLISGEVEIQSNQDSIFAQTNVKDRCVRVTGEALFVDGLGVVASVHK